MPGALYKGTGNVGKWGIPEKGSRNAIQKCLFRVASALQLIDMAKPNSGNSVPCILSCKIGGSQNLMKERYLRKTPNVTFVYLSKCDIKLPSIFGNSKKRFLRTGLVDMLFYVVPT